MTEVNDPDSGTLRGEERPGHHVLTAVRPKRDMDAEEPIDNEIEKEAVRPKSDMDAEKFAETEIENDAVRPKCDDEAVAVDEDATKKQEKNANEGAAAAKKILEESDEVTNEDVEIGRLIEVRRETTPKRSEGTDKKVYQRQDKI